MIPELEPRTRRARCRCVATTTDGRGPGRCPHDATPDSPFCTDCETRHPDAGPMVKVDAVPLDEHARR